MLYSKKRKTVQDPVTFHTGRLPLKYNKEERLEVGRKIHESGLSNLKAAELFGISEESARRYRILYEHSQGIVRDSGTRHKGKLDTTAFLTQGEPSGRAEDYSSMTKEELIEELLKSRIREARLKKGYMVKGVGVDKEYILLDNKNTK